MSNILLGTLAGFAIGLCTSQYTTIYRLSCDTNKYGWMWTNAKRLQEEPFVCRYNEGQRIERETNSYMIYQTIKNEVDL